MPSFLNSETRGRIVMNRALQVSLQLRAEEDTFLFADCVFSCWVCAFVLWSCARQFRSTFQIGVVPDHGEES